MLLYAMLRFEESVVGGQTRPASGPGRRRSSTPGRGQAYFFAGRVDEANASWQKALELDPGYADASLVLARTLLTQGNHEAGHRRASKGSRLQ